MQRQNNTISGGGFNATDYLISGGEAVIRINATAREVDATRGSSVTVPIILTYLPGENAQAVVHVSANGIEGVMIPPSVAARSTPQERAELLTNTGRIPGAIELTQFAIFSPNYVILKPYESVTIDMTITIPKDFTSEVNGMFFSPAFESPENRGPYTVYLEIVTGVWVNLVE